MQSTTVQDNSVCRDGGEVVHTLDSRPQTPVGVRSVCSRPGTLSLVAAGSWVRAARRARRLSQRELAALVAVPLSTISRIESGRTVPRLDTFVQLLASMGYELVIVDQNLRMLTLDAEHDRLRDRGGRQFPAHLIAGRTPSYWEGGWWGWERIAWPFAGWVPEFTFWRRPPPPKTVGEWTIRPALWDDAT